MASTTSTHHSVQASIAAQDPQAGTHTNTIMLMIVARLIGNAPAQSSQQRIPLTAYKRLITGDIPRNNDCTGCMSIKFQTPGKSAYLRIEMIVKRINKTVFNAKMTTEIQYNHIPLYGRLWSRIETMPVPIVMLNQDGVKLSTTRRHPC